MSDTCFDEQMKEKQTMTGKENPSDSIIFSPEEK